MVAEGYREINLHRGYGDRFEAVNLTIGPNEQVISSEYYTDRRYINMPMDIGQNGEALVTFLTTECDPVWKR